MKRTATIVLALMLLFTVVFTMAATIYAKQAQTNKPMRNFDCCVIYNGYNCTLTYGVWYEGTCYCQWPGENPNGCVITTCWFYCG